MPKKGKTEAKKEGRYPSQFVYIHNGNYVLAVRDNTYPHGGFYYTLRSRPYKTKKLPTVKCDALRYGYVGFSLRTIKYLKSEFKRLEKLLDILRKPGNFIHVAYADTGTVADRFIRLKTTIGCIKQTGDIVLKVVGVVSRVHEFACKCDACGTIVDDAYSHAIEQGDLHFNDVSDLFADMRGVPSWVKKLPVLPVKEAEPSESEVKSLAVVNAVKDCIDMLTCHYKRSGPYTASDIKQLRASLKSTHELLESNPGEFRKLVKVTSANVV